MVGVGDIEVFASRMALSEMGRGVGKKAVLGMLRVECECWEGQGSRRKEISQPTGAVCLVRRMWCGVIYFPSCIDFCI